MYKGMGSPFLWRWNWKFLCLVIFLKVVLSSLVQPCRPESAKYNLGCQCELRYQNCSLRDRYDGDTHFNCIVGRKAEWEQYKKTLQHVAKCKNVGCDPALITNIQSRIEGGSPFLNISFSVPRAFITGRFHPGVILLNISVTDQNEVVQDQTFVHVGHRLRLFDFSQYQSTSDVNKRVISFPCILGFDIVTEENHYKVYSLKLTTFSKYRIQEAQNHVIPYTTITFNVTIYNYYLRSEDWMTIMAVSRYPTSEDIYLVFEPAPANYQIDEYKITLMKCFGQFCNSSVSSGVVKHSSGRYIHRFNGIGNGKYQVKIIAEGENCGRCKPYLSDLITIGSNLPQKRLITHDDYLSKALFSVLGAVIAVLLLIPGYVIYRRRRQANTPATDKKVLLLYPSADRETARCLVHYLRNNLGKDIDYDQDDFIRVIQNVPSWYTEKIDSANCIIILWSPSSLTPSMATNSDSPAQDFFQNAMYQAFTAKSNRVTELKIVSIYFRNVDKNLIPAKAKQMSKMFLMFDEFKSFYKFIYGSNPLPSNAKYLDKKKYIKPELCKKDFTEMNSNLENLIPRPNNSNSVQFCFEDRHVHNPYCPVHDTKLCTNIQDFGSSSLESLKKEMLEINDIYQNPEKYELVDDHSDESTESDDEFKGLDLYQKFLAVNAS